MSVCKSVSMTSTAYHKEHKITLIIDLSIELNISQFDNACMIVRNKHFVSRHIFMYHMKEISNTMLYIYRNCFMIESIQVDERDQSVIHGLGADISLPQLGSKSDHRAKITGSILWYNTLVSRPEVLRLISCLNANPCLLYTSPSPRDLSTSRMPSSA